MQTALRSDSCRSIVIVFRCFRARKCTRRTQICRKLPRRWRPLSNIRAFTLRENISFSEAWLNEKRPPDKRHALRSYFQHKPQEVRSKAHENDSFRSSCSEGKPKPKTKHTHNTTKKTIVLLGLYRTLSVFVSSCSQFSFREKRPSAGFLWEDFPTPRKNMCDATNFTIQITIEIWLILPVVICLFQGLSHACLRITALQESAHGSLHQTQSAAKMLRSPQKWITWRNAKLIHESMDVLHSRGFGRSEASCE